jgi:hypothetical protein
MTAFVCYCGTNSAGKHDGDLFRSEAQAFARAHGTADPVDLDAHGTAGWQRRGRLLQSLTHSDDSTADDVLALFCHGTAHWVQAGFRTQDNTVDLISKALTKHSHNITVALYCCSTADGDTETNEVSAGTDGGFADRLRDGLCERGARSVHVFGHKTAGHATMNPYVVEFTGPAPAVGGQWLVGPGTELWDKWRTALRGPLRFLFPLMTREAIVARLRGMP